jgi:hypothetical protein
MNVPSALNLWGPAVMVCLSVVLGFIWNNGRLTDLRNYIDARFNAQDKRMDDLRDFVRSEVRRLEERISPLHPTR